MNFDHVARWYRWLEYAGFGGELQRRRCAFLKDVGEARRPLLLGGGDGRFLVELVRQNREASIDYVDLSLKMLELARRRAGETTVRYLHASALTAPLPESEYDLICTHFFLDCFDEGDLKKLVERISRAARPQARWLISEFRQPSWWAHAVVQALYCFFRITAGLRTTRLVDHRPELHHAGFRLVKEQRSRGGLLVSELWARPE